MKLEEVKTPSILMTDHAEFAPSIELVDINFSYPNASNQALAGISIKIEPGQSLAIVGSSGAGKSTLADIILGVIHLQTSDGFAKISGMPPKEAMSLWPGAIGYVPQRVEIVNGTLKENVALGFNSHDIPDELVWNALKIAQLETFALEKEARLETLLGERGSKLSGGQRQRIGIARAFLTNPQLVVLDEATSALDGQTEFDFVTLLEDIRRSRRITLVTIAHRLSTIKNADMVLFMEMGKIKGQGTFSELRELIPDFESLVSLMNLESKD